jgi:hypothetical protein
MIGSVTQPSGPPQVTGGSVHDDGVRRVSLQASSEERKFLQGRHTVHVRFDLTATDDGWDIALVVDRPEDAWPFIEKFVMRFSERFRLAPGQFYLVLDPATFGRPIGS